MNMSFEFIGSYYKISIANGQYTELFLNVAKKL